MTRRKLAAIAFGITFVAGLLGCAAHGWHAPHMPVLVLVYALGILFGTMIAALKPRGEEWLRSPWRIAIATLLGIATSAAGGALLGFVIMGDWTELVLASIVGSLWMGSYPLHPLLWSMALDRKIEIGLDAIAIGRTFVPLHRVRAVTWIGSVLTIHLQNGHKIDVPLWSDAIAAQFADRIRALLAPIEIPAHTTREGRSLETWRRDLLSPGYRSSGLSTEVAERVLSASSAKPEERVAAAIILAHAGDRVRVAEIASRCVEPRMRVALELAAQDALDEVTLDALAK